jgi:diadenosine tetraphosphatase ApaH/serine/threonine PP2A family protein phosphatase
MRVAVFADIHGNLAALEAVLADAGQRQVDRYVCLGDLVGYGANPNRCIERICGLPRLNVILGNHDAAAVWRTSPYLMNALATEAILWTMERLTKAHSAWLKTRPTRLDMGPLNFSHANPYNPMAWRYLNERKYALRSFSHCKAQVLFVGHTHQPMVITRENLWRIRFEAAKGSVVVPARPRNRQIINCGSVGQPRDANPKAAYCIYDSRRQCFEFHRLQYDVGGAMARIRAAGLPDSLATRLAKGV